jgi:hypothetical protein
MAVTVRFNFLVVAAKKRKADTTAGCYNKISLSLSLSLSLSHTRAN